MEPDFEVPTGAVYWAGRTPRPNNGTPNMAAALRLCPELVAILGGDLIRGYMI